MAMTLELPEGLAQTVTEQAARIGTPVEGYLLRMIERGAQVHARFERARASFQKKFEESGLSDQEFEALVEEARYEVWRKNQCTSS